MGWPALYLASVALADRVIAHHRARLQGRARRITIDLDPTDDPTAALAVYTCAGGDVLCDAQYEEAFARFSAASDPPTQQAAAHEMVRQLASEGVEVVLFAPDDVQAFRTDNVVALLQPPDAVRPVTMRPSVAQYSDALPAPAPAPARASLTRSTHATTSGARRRICSFSTGLR